jgi:hypothetical protein
MENEKIPYALKLLIGSLAINHLNRLIFNGFGKTVLVLIEGLI